MVKTNKGLASHTDSDEQSVNTARNVVRGEVRSRTHPDEGISATELSARTKAQTGNGVSPSTVRDIIQQLKIEEQIPIANFGKGYFRITHEEHFQEMMNDKMDQIETLKNTAEVMARAWYSGDSDAR